MTTTLPHIYEHFVKYSNYGKTYIHNLLLPPVSPGKTLCQVIHLILSFKTYSHVSINTPTNTFQILPATRVLPIFKDI